MNCRFYIMVLWMVLASEVNGQNKIIDVPIEYWSKNQGLRSSNVTNSSVDSNGVLFLAFLNGLVKEEKISIIKNHIIDLINNEATPMSPSIAKNTFELLYKVGNKISENALQNNNEILSVLTNREQEVLELMMKGYSYKQISEQLYVSPNTVRKHIAHIYEKLHINSKTQMMNLLK